MQIEDLPSYHFNLLQIQQIYQFLLQKVFRLLIKSQYLFQYHEMLGVQQKLYYLLYQQAKHVVRLVHQNLYQQYTCHFVHDSVQLKSIFFRRHDFLIFEHLSQLKDQLISRFYPNLFLFFLSFLDCVPLAFSKVGTKLPRSQVIKLIQVHVRFMFFLLQANH